MSARSCECVDEKWYSKDLRWETYEKKLWVFFFGILHFFFNSEQCKSHSSFFFFVFPRRESLLKNFGKQGKIFLSWDFTVKPSWGLCCWRYPGSHFSFPPLNVIYSAFQWHSIRSGRLSLSNPRMPNCSLECNYEKKNDTHNLGIRLPDLSADANFPRWYLPVPWCPTSPDPSMKKNIKHSHT